MIYANFEDWFKTEKIKANLDEKKKLLRAWNAQQEYIDHLKTRMIAKEKEMCQLREMVQRKMCQKEV